MDRLVCVVIGYVFGLFQTSYIYGKLKHVDIRDYGSGNAGTTNAMRVLGKKAGVITYIGDCLKAILASVVIYFLFKDGDTSLLLLKIYGGLGVVLGHNFPFYMKFRGGKGIAASSGVIVGLGDWKLILLAFVGFTITTVITKYVSAGSLTMMGLFMIEFVIFNQLGILGFKSDIQFTGKSMIEVYILVLVITALAFIKHKDNIQRLINGNERKIGQKKEI